MADITPARKLFDLLVSKDFNPEMLDSSGKPAPDPAEAEIFSFDFRAESGKDYGTVVIMLSDDGELQVYCADNVGKTMEGNDKTEWFNFLEQLKNFAVRTNRMNFSVKNLNHLRYSMQGQAAIKEGLFESWAGKKDISWNAGATESRLMIKHKRSLGEGEARFRYVESLFIETAEGERYKLPFKNLTAGKAMLEHVRNGGRPYDDRGQHIVEMVSELTVLSRFRRANHGKLLEGDTAQLVEQTNAYYENLQRNLKSMTHRRGYETYFESWTQSEVSEESMVIEGLKHLFVTQSIDQRIEDALPLIAKIQQQENAMKEANIFEAWANTLVEGTWQLPDTPEKQAKLVELMSQDLPVGADATNATEQLYDLIGDDILFDKLEELAERDANADARQVVYDRLSELSEHPSVREVIDQFNIDADATMNPPEATNPVDLEPADDVAEAIKDATTQTEDPAGTQQPKYPAYQDDLASILKTAGVPAQERPAPDYEVENDLEEGHMKDIDIARQDCEKMTPTQFIKAYGQSKEAWYAKHKDLLGDMEEGVLGTLGGAGLGMMLGGPLGAAIGAVGGQEMTKGGSGIIEQGEEETDEGWKGELAGGTVGTLAGTAAGAALGPVGAVVGGALGGTAGQMIGDKLGGNEEETDEGKLGALAGGAVGGYATKSVKGAIGGAKIGSALQDRFAKKEKTNETDMSLFDDATCNMTEAGESCPVHGVEECWANSGSDSSPLAGQYGHSGKMKEVGKETSFLDRLKELSGMIRN